MESTTTISNIIIPIEEISYNKKSKVFIANFLGFTYIAHYKKSVRIREILDEIHESLEKIVVNREDISIVDAFKIIISETLKLKDLIFPKKTEVEKEKPSKDKKKGKKQKSEEIATQEKAKPALQEEDMNLFKSVKTRDDEGMIDDEMMMEEEEEMAEVLYDEREKVVSKEAQEVSKKEKRRSKAAPKKDYAPPPRRASAPAAPPAPAPAPGGGASSGAKLAELREEISAEEPIISESKPEGPKTTQYDINMGFQYYSVMMEQQSYFFYVYFSHEELIIADEDGKTVYKTTFSITTTKDEPPILDLRIEGEGFEVHPLSGKVEVKKKFVNPPVMIFSILPTKSKKTKKEKKEGEKRFLHIYIDFEDNNVSHSVLSITVQPKHFHLDIGPFHLDMSKTTAILVSIISILITVGSAVYSLLTLDIGSPTTDVLTSFVPGIGSLIFLVTFIYTLLTEGVFPIKEQVSSLLNFDKGIATLK